MIFGKLITWRKYQIFIIFDIDCEGEDIEIIIEKHKIFNFEQIYGGRYVLFDFFKKEVFII